MLKALVAVAVLVSGVALAQEDDAEITIYDAVSVPSGGTVSWTGVQYGIDGRAEQVSWVAPCKPQAFTLEGQPEAGRPRLKCDVCTFPKLNLCCPTCTNCQVILTPQAE